MLERVHAVGLVTIKPSIISGLLPKLRVSRESRGMVYGEEMEVSKKNKKRVRR